VTYCFEDIDLGALHGKAGGGFGLYNLHFQALVPGFVYDAAARAYFGADFVGGGEDLIKHGFTP